MWNPNAAKARKNVAPGKPHEKGGWSFPAASMI
jgi:hypothetical protein